MKAPFSPHHLPAVSMVFALLILSSAACAPNASLADFTENDVHVSIRIEQSGADGAILAATFTPPAGYHLYSKDIPFGGVEGLGRPTRLELPENARLRPAGAMTESVAAEIPSFEPKTLLVYPAGPVTLSLPVTWPAAAEPFEATISVTFMACSQNGCKPPVVGKIIPIKIKPSQ